MCIIGGIIFYPQAKKEGHLHDTFLVIVLTVVTEYLSIYLRTK